MQCWISISSLAIPTRNYFGWLDSNDRANCVTDPSIARIFHAVSHCFNEVCLFDSPSLSNQEIETPNTANNTRIRSNCSKSKQWAEILWQMQSEWYFGPSYLTVGWKQNVSYFHLKICKTPSLLPTNPDCQALHHFTITIKPKTGARNANTFRMTEWWFSIFEWQ